MYINLLNPILSGAVKNSITDEEIIKVYVESQNAEYFDVLYDRYSSKVYAKCISILKNQFLAEDATQEVFVKVLLNMSKFGGKSKFSSWLYSITYNYCIDIVRKNSRESDILWNAVPKADRVEYDSIDDNKLKETNIKRLQIVLDKIPPQDKAILLMKYLEEFTIDEICEILNKSQSAVKMKIKRAKEKFVIIYESLYQQSLI